MGGLFSALYTWIVLPCISPKTQQAIALNTRKREDYEKKIKEIDKKISDKIDVVNDFANTMGPNFNVAQIRRIIMEIERLNQIKATYESLSDKADALVGIMEIHSIISVDSELATETSGLLQGMRGTLDTTNTLSEQIEKMSDDVKDIVDTNISFTNSVVNDPVFNGNSNNTPSWSTEVMDAIARQQKSDTTALDFSGIISFYTSTSRQRPHLTTTSPPKLSTKTDVSPPATQETPRLPVEQESPPQSNAQDEPGIQVLADHTPSVLLPL